MVANIISFKFFRKSILIYCILYKFFFFFPNLLYASETFGDAMKWYENHGSELTPKQNYIIGLKFEKEGNFKKALIFFRKAANKNLTQAQIKLGSYLIKSVNLDNQKKAKKIFKSLSDKSIPSASFKLGWMYENNIGGERNLSKASQFYKIAASRNINKAYLYLANLSLAEQNKNNLMIAASYASIAKKKNVIGSDKLLRDLLSLLEEDELESLGVLILSLESEIQKIGAN